MSNKEKLDPILPSSTLCAYCPKMCRFSCPVSEAESRETVTPWAKMSILYLAWQGQMDTDHESVVRALEACTGCGACVEQCAHGNPVAETLFTARGIIETDRSLKMRDAFQKTGDVKNRPLHKRAAPYARDQNAKIAYFPGCTQLTDQASSVEKSLKLLAHALDVPVPLVDLPQGKWCCGYPLYADGQMEPLATHLDAMAELLSQHEMIITPDPGCAYILTTVQKEIGSSAFDTEVLPLVEVLARYKSKFKDSCAGQRLKYHDPCYLGRRGRSFKGVRDLLETASGASVVEFTNHCDKSDCSGGGGLYPVSHPEGAKKMASRRVAQDSNPEPYDVLVTACPSALRSFRRAGIDARDVIDVLMAAIN